MRCESCRHENDDAKKFCTQCGALLGGRRCDNGHAIPDGLTDCPFCPRPVARPPSASPSQDGNAARRQGTMLVSHSELQRSGVQASPGASSPEIAPPPLGQDRVAFGEARPGAAAPSARGRTVFRSPDAPDGMAQPGYDAAPGGVPRLPTASKSAFSSPLVGFLVSFSSDPHGQPWPIRYGRTSIGSDPGSEVFLPFPGISTRHAEVMVRDNQGSPKIWVSDCNSTNGTKLDGADIFTDRPDLYHGAIITVSGIDLLFISIQ